MLFVNALGGLALFLFGMKLMSRGLQKAAGEKMRTVLRFFSSNRFAGILSGTVVTSVIQSSSVTTVMVIGFINAGLLTLQQSVGIIFGANIGTTITAQLVAFKIGVIIMPSIILGLGLTFFKNEKAVQLGETLLGLGLLFFGMEIMGGELKQLAKDPAFVSAFQMFDCTPGANGIIPPVALFGAIGIGLVATMIIQSSSACTGIVIALSAGGMIDLYTAVGLLLGTNIGTTVTAQLAALTANRVARQAALLHTLFNVIGVLIAVATFLITWGGEPAFFHLIRAVSGSEASLQRQIANAHTLFNVGTTLLLIPFMSVLPKICEAIIPVKTDVRYTRLEPHLLNTPAIALSQTAAELRKMLKRAWKMTNIALNIYANNDERNQERVKTLPQREEEIDARQHDIANYLTALMLKPLSPRESRQIPVLIHCTNDAEKIGDYAMELCDLMKRIKADKVRFSEDAELELERIHGQLETLTENAVDLLKENHTRDPETARAAHAEMRKMLDEAELTHMNRLYEGKCVVRNGVLFMELLEKIRKTERHIFNIAERAGDFYGKLPDVG
ncbi:MAG: Na/Pi cotransporter family protein [Lentisphaeria bacterium]|nr:Na/Pi cotransporter family protein [Lentisphaeria bacterium]